MLTRMIRRPLSWVQCATVRQALVCRLLVNPIFGHLSSHPSLAVESQNGL
jgi:hypothetical protein